MISHCDLRRQSDVTLCFEDHLVMAMYSVYLYNTGVSPISVNSCRYGINASRSMLVD